MKNLTEYINEDWQITVHTYEVPVIYDWVMDNFPMYNVTHLEEYKDRILNNGEVNWDVVRKVAQIRGSKKQPIIVFSPHPEMFVSVHFGSPEWSKPKFKALINDLIKRIKDSKCQDFYICNWE